MNPLMGLDDEAMRALMLLRQPTDPARPSTTPFTDAAPYAFRSQSALTPLAPRAPGRPRVDTSVDPSGDRFFSSSGDGYEIRGSGQAAMGRKDWRGLIDDAKGRISDAIPETPPVVARARDNLLDWSNAGPQPAPALGLGEEDFPRALDALGISIPGGVLGTNPYEPIPTNTPPGGIAPFPQPGEGPGAAAARADAGVVTTEPAAGAAVETPETPAQPGAPAASARSAAVPKDMVIGRNSGGAAAVETSPGSPGASSPGGMTPPAAPSPAELPEWNRGQMDDAARQEAIDSALLRAGLSMMASDNPSFMGVLGEGGMAGLEGFEADKQRFRDDAFAEREMMMKEAGFESAQAQQQFENEIARISTELAFAKDAREERALGLAAARAARAAAGGDSTKLPKNPYEFYLFMLNAELSSLARNSPDGMVDPVQAEQARQNAERLTRSIAGRQEDGLAGLMGDNGSTLPPIGSSAASIIGGAE